MQIARKFAAVSCAAAAGLMTLGIESAPAAHASGNARELALAGSDTIYGVDTALVPTFNSSAKYNPDGSTAVNLAPTAVLNPAQVTVPGDADAPSFTYGGGTSPQVPYINGSTAGKAAICGNNAAVQAVGTHDVIDIARSSSNSAPTCSVNYYAFALDGVTIVVGKNGDAGPVPATGYNYTDAQVTAAFKCDPTVHHPLTNDWGSIGGTPGKPIIRYVTNPASGTLSFFQSKYLGGQSETANCAGDPNLRAPAPNGFIEENDMSVPSANGDLNHVFQFFSCAQFTAQKNGTLHDTRHGYKKAQIDGKKCQKTGFFSDRYVFHYIATDTSHESAIGQQQAVNFGGIGLGGAAGKPGYACSVDAQSTINLYGFKSLTPDSKGNYCLLNPPNEP